MLLAAAKPVEGRIWRHSYAAQYVMENLAGGNGGKALHGTGERNRAQSTTWQAQRNPLRQSPRRFRRASPTRSPFKRPYSGGDAAETDSRRPRFKSGGLESVGRAPRDGVRDAKPKRRSRKNQGQKPKQSPGDDAGGCEPGSKPSLDGIAGLAASPAWLERARARFERKFYAEGTWSSRASKRRKV